MTSEQIGGLVRTTAAALFGYLGIEGVVGAETVMAVAGAAGVIAVGVWSYIVKRRG